MKSLNLHVIIAQVQAFCQPRQYQGFQLKTVELETLLRLTSAKQKCCDLKHKLSASQIQTIGIRARSLF